MRSLCRCEGTYLRPPALLNGTADFVKSALLDSLRQVAAVMNDAGEPHRAAYQDTWDFLQDTISLWPLGGPRGGIISWPVHIGEDYIALLKQGDWIARILFLHYGVGMHLLSDKWYVSDWGRRLVAAVLQPLQEIPPIWTETITWIRQAVDLNG